MIIGYKLPKSQNQDIKWYSSAYIDYINEKGDRAVLNFRTLSDDSRESTTKAIITYNPKFENAVVEITSPAKNVTKNIHRIQMIQLSHEINPTEKKIGEYYYFNNNNFTYVNNDHKLRVVNGMIVENTLNYEEYSKASRSYYVKFGESLPLLAHEILSRQDQEKSAMEKLWDNKKQKQKWLDEELERKEQRELIIHNGVTIKDTLFKEQKTLRYPLIYKLKEREDYKTVKQLFDTFVTGRMSDGCLIYDHNDDKFQIDGKNITRSNITILDIYRK